LQSSFAGFQHETYPANFTDIPILGQLRFSSALKATLASIAETTIIHVHGLWRMPNVYPAVATKRSKNRIILSPRGMLGEAALQFSAYKKQIFWLLAQGAAARAASCLHATSRQEYEDIRAFGLKAPIAIIPNGIDLPLAKVKGRPQEAFRTLLYLGRIHPKKGLDLLIDAWDLTKDRHANWQLDIVGPIDNEYARTLQARVGTKPTSRIRWLGPLYGQDKDKAYQRAELFVLPSLNENFAMTVAEALAQGTPVISTKGAPWAGLNEQNCGWWIDQGAQSLSVALDEAMGMGWERLASMGQAGRSWMCRDFAWSAVAASMRSVYDWLFGQAQHPHCVIMD
jgi:glycosyltransferase involved in cell wall biosynthesis